MTEKKRKRPKFSEKLSSISADKLSAAVVVLAYISIVEILILSTLYFNIDDHSLSLFLFLSDGLINIYYVLLKN